MKDEVICASRLRKGDAQRPFILFFISLCVLRALCGKI